MLRSKLIALPEFKGWSTWEIAALLYDWADPREAKRVYKIAPGEKAIRWNECLNGNFICVGWDDVGDFDLLASLLPATPDDLRVLGDPALVVNNGSRGAVVPASGRLVAVLGLDDVVVVDTPDALLVVARSRAQDVKAVVDALRAAGRTDLL